MWFPYTLCTENLCYISNRSRACVFACLCECLCVCLCECLCACLCECLCVHPCLQVYPTRLRATGLGAAYTWGRVGGITTPFIAQVWHHWLCHCVIHQYVICMCACLRLRVCIASRKVTGKLNFVYSWIGCGKHHTTKSLECVEVPATLQCLCSPLLGIIGDWGDL